VGHKIDLPKTEIRTLFSHPDSDGICCLRKSANRGNNAQFPYFGKLDFDRRISAIQMPGGKEPGLILPFLWLFYGVYHY
jgi:hypothetical protein